MNPGDLLTLVIESVLTAPFDVTSDDEQQAEYGETGDTVILLERDHTPHFHLIFHPTHGARSVYFKSVQAQA